MLIHVFSLTGHARSRDVSACADKDVRHASGRECCAEQLERSSRELWLTAVSYKLCVSSRVSVRNCLLGL